ncbi:hypothetical protein [Candidatus Viadribacter manganicus]|uniref:DUF2846 domain-containing protein n=1 Tax=Candidatus Viadribacter manganicus TaxID=1759059 RepID=A0A1B1AL38_9PROT|nr:hypothetical protein [Candidatus Viadribacter manganicus]ANP47255.1 hypothetical protein ATE48_15675 [Candidatus Viadribacter manganicus]
MPRNLVLYGLAVIAGVIGYTLLRSLVGGEIMAIFALVVAVVAVVIVVRNLQTNRNVAQATPQEREQALTFAPVAGKGVLYIFRNQFVGRAVGINVLIDGREVAQLKSPRFTRLLLTPGSHRLAGYTGTNKAPAPGEDLELIANAGEVYVCKCEVEPQMIGVTIKYTPLPLDAGRTEVKKITRMVTPDVGDI